MRYTAPTTTSTGEDLFEDRAEHFGGHVVALALKGDPMGIRPLAVGCGCSRGVFERLDLEKIGVDEVGVRTTLRVRVR